MGISYRLFDPEQDEEMTRALFSLSFPETIGTSIGTNSHQSWKFQDFPDAVPSYRYVAVDDGEIVGYYAAIPYSYLIDAKPRRCGMVCDVMTHPAHRGKGIFTGIGLFATEAMKAEGVAFTTGYPIRPEVIPGHLKVGWKVVVSLPMYLRPLGLRSFLPGALRPLAKLLNPLLWLAQCWALVRTKHYSCQTLSREQFLQSSGGGAVEGTDDTYGAFFSEWAAQQPNALQKSAEFLRWRTGAPETIYQFVLLRHEGHQVGMAIVRPTALRGVQTLAIVDFMVLPNHLDGCRNLHIEIRRLARLHGKDAIACMISQQWAKSYHFLGSAYLKTPALFSLIVKKLDKALSDEEIYAGNRWHVFWLDSDDL